MITQTEHDLSNIKEYIVYHVLLLVLSYNKARFKNTELKLQNIFEEAYDQLVTEVERDFIRHKLNMKKSNIRISKETTSPKGVNVLYDCRGYKSEFNMWTGYLKGEVEEKLRGYLQRIVASQKS